MVPTNAAIGPSHETARTIAPHSIISGVTTAITTFANGEASGTKPEKYIVYGSMNKGTHKPNMTNSRSPYFVEIH